METPKVIHDYLNTLRSQESSGREPHMGEPGKIKTEHSATPWLAIGHVIGIRDLEYTDSINSIAFTEGMKREANARRIVACVNACTGIPSEVLEVQNPGGALHGMTKELQAERDRLSREVSALRAALEPFIKFADEIDRLRHEDDSTCLHRIKASDLRAARAALNQTQGE